MLLGYFGTDLPIDLTLSGGETGLYPQVHIYNAAGSEISGSPFDMTHKANGFYLYTWTPTDKAQFKAVFKVYTNAIHTLLSPLYGVNSEVIFITDDLDAIKTQTDKLTFDGSNNIQARVNDKGVLNNPPSESINDYKADVSNLDVAVSTRSSHSVSDIWSNTTRTLTSFGSLIADIWAYVTRTLTSGTKDTEIDEIKAKTDNLPSDPTSETQATSNKDEIIDAVNVAGIQDLRTTEES